MKINRQLWVIVIWLIFSLEGSSAIVQLNERNFNDQINTNAYTLVYFFSSSCKFCQEFNPLFEKLSKSKNLTSKGVAFGKIDAPAYQSITSQFHIHTYPTISFFFQGIFYPISYFKERSEEEITNFINRIIKPTDDPSLLSYIFNMTLIEKIQIKTALFYGKRDSLEFKKFNVVALRDGYLNWAHIDAEEPKLVIAETQITNFQIDFIEAQITQIFAKLHPLTEEAWLKMAEKKKFTIFYLNKYRNKKVVALLQKLAKQLYQVHFMEIDGENEEFKPVVRHFGVNDEENIIAHDKLYDALYVADPPYTEEKLRQFIKHAQNHSIPIYRKSEKSDKPNKMTRQNYEQKMGTSQDVLLFLYDKKDKHSKNFMSLFEYLIVKLRDNKNLLLLRCDVGVNEIEEKLGFIPKPLPQVVFFRNRQKQNPIHFSQSTISAENVIQFIMENTTFDFEDEWAEL